MSFPKYPKYKPSGVEWLGDVPEQWPIDRIKRSTISCKNGIWGDEAQQDENDIPCVRVADFDREKLSVRLNDPKPSVCSNFVARVEVAAGMDVSFWRYFHAAAYSVRLNTRSIKQTSGIQNLDQQQYFDERAAFPRHDEQTAIAAFLDRETGKIDELVAEQRRLIELLKEKRQAVISHAVTKGLNPTPPPNPPASNGSAMCRNIGR